MASNVVRRNRVDKEYLFETIFNGRLIESEEEKRKHFERVLNYLLNLLPEECDYRLINTVETYTLTLIRTVIPSAIIETIEQIDRIIGLAWRLKNNNLRGKAKEDHGKRSQYH
mgnify:CR=1 FL=1